MYFRLQPRTEVLLKALVSKGVDNRDSLLKAWRTDPTCKLEFFSFSCLSEIWTECVFQFTKQSLFIKPITLNRIQSVFISPWLQWAFLKKIKIFPASVIVIVCCVLFCFSLEPLTQFSKKCFSEYCSFKVLLMKGQASFHGEVIWEEK